MANHKPMRLCIGCRTREMTTNLVRVAYDRTVDSRSLVIDERSVLPGRGAWVHREPGCLSTALQRRAFNRAFRNQVDTEKLEAALLKCREDDTNTPNNDESGSEN
ncbi:MAG: YlxR family protein [Yaniella sp.]|uniref:YlxR family protein n=2 Tax=Yaniella sp. TaxID=2773929 RepID=UPI00181B99EF|nr:YlxR family protein [Micrococcus sp.]